MKEIIYISDRIKEENGEVAIPMEEVEFEKQKRISAGEVIVTYVFKDGSSVKVKYTKEKDIILKREKGLSPYKRFVEYKRKLH